MYKFCLCSKLGLLKFFESLDIYFHFELGRYRCVLVLAILLAVVLFILVRNFEYA